MKFNKHDLKEKLIIFLVMGGVFLPVRLFFYTYISQVWYGSFGLVSALAVIMAILVHYNKLGRFGVIFKRQMHRTIRGKLGSFMIITSIAVTALVLYVIFWIDRGDNYYFEERQTLLAVIATMNKDFDAKLKESNIPYPEKRHFDIANSMNEKQKEIYIVEHFNNIDFAASAQFSLDNADSHGWMLHLYIVFVVSEMEALGMLFLYRHIYRNEPLLTCSCGEPNQKHGFDCLKCGKKVLQ